MYRYIYIYIHIDICIERERYIPPPLEATRGLELPGVRYKYIIYNIICIMYNICYADIFIHINIFIHTD